MTATRGVAGLWETPIVGAPLGGGPSTPALAAAVSEADGLGFVAAGYKTVAAVEAELDELRTLTSRINLFCPVREQVDPAAIDAYDDRMRLEGERYGVEPGQPQWSDDEWAAKLDLVSRASPEVVSFTFGCPERAIIESLHGASCRVWCTVTSGRGRAGERTRSRCARRPGSGGRRTPGLVR